MNYWGILGIESTVDLKVIKKAYASKLRLYHPEDDPKGFQNLREAYENALKEAKYIKEVNSSNTTINEEPSLHNEYDEILPNTKFDNSTNSVEKENLGIKDEDLVNLFMSRVCEIYNNFFTRIDINNWKGLLQDQNFWILNIKESLCFNMLEFLMDNYYLPHNVWCALDEYFYWTENEEYLYEEFDERFINYIISQVRETQSLRYEFFKKDYECDYDEFIRHRNNAYYALMNNNLEECGKAVMSAMEIFPDDPDLIRMLGIYYLRIEDSKNAELAFTHLIEINPKEIDGHLNRGYILIRQERINEAYYDFQNALNVNSDNISALKGLAECYFHFNNLIEAKLLYSQISENCVFDLESRLRIVEINAKLIDKYKNELTNNPKNIDILYELAKTYFEMESFEECHKTIKNLIKNQEVNSDIYLLLGRTLAGMKRNKESLKYFSKALIVASKEGTNSYEILFHRGLVNLQLENYEEAIQDFSGTLKINRYNAEALYNLSEIYLQTGRYSEALEFSNKAISTDSSKWIYYSVRGIANFRLKNYAQSKNDHAIVVKHEYSFSEAWYRKGYCHLQLLQYEEAIDCFKEAIDWKVEAYKDAHLRLSLAYFKLEDFKSALTEAKCHCEDNANDICGFILMGDIYRVLGISSKAEEAYIKAYELKPNSHKLLKILGYFYLNKNELKKAFQYLKKLIDIYKDDENAYIVFLWLCVELNESVAGTAAFADYEKLLKDNKISNVNPYALFYYSVIIYKKGFKKSMYKLAAQKLEKVIELGLKNGDLLSYLSMIYYELEDKENSIKYAKEAIAIDPSNVEYKIRYEGILQYCDKRNFLIFKNRPPAMTTWPIIGQLELQTFIADLPILNISIGENYE